MTGTTMDYEITMAFSDYIQNKTLAAVMSDALVEAGPPSWTQEEYRLAGEFFRTYPKSTQLNILEQLADDLSEYASIDQQPKLEGRNMHMLIAPLPGAAKKLKEAKAAAAAEEEAAKKADKDSAKAEAAVAEKVPEYDEETGIELEEEFPGMN